MSSTCPCIAASARNKFRRFHRRLSAQRRGLCCPWVAGSTAGPAPTAQSVEMYIFITPVTCFMFLQRHQLASQHLCTAATATSLCHPSPRDTSQGGVIPKSFIARPHCAHKPPTTLARHLQAASHAGVCFSRCSPLGRLLLLWGCHAALSTAAGRQAASSCALCANVQATECPRCFRSRRGGGSRRPEGGWKEASCLTTAEWAG